MSYALAQRSQKEGRERGGPDPCPKKICALIFKKQFFSINVCVMSNTSVQFFVNISLTMR